MAKKDLFTRLQRLFSSEVVIRNVGGNTIKTIDINSIQTTGEFKTNSLVDRYSRLYSQNVSSLYGTQINQQYRYLRTTLYSEYDAMDTDAIIASALDIIADESTLKNDLGEVLSIRSSNENVQNILYNLFYDVLNVEFNMWSWIRQMCKYGDFFLKLEISEQFGVYNAIPYTAFHITRHENFNPEKPADVKYIFHPEGAIGGDSIYNNSTLLNTNTENSIVFDNYEMAHFRLISDVNFLPYGRCLHPSSRVYTENSYKEIKDIQKGDKVWTFNIKENKYELADVLNTVNSGIKEIYSVRTSHNEIKASDNHPVMVWNDSLKDVEYRQVKDLNVGDYIAHVTELDIQKEPVKLSKNNMEVGSYDWKTDLSPYNNFPNVVDKEFARFWGFMLGDGYTSSTTHSVGFACGIDDKQNQYYRTLLNKFSGINKINETTSKQSILDISGYYVNSKIFKHLMELNGYLGKSYNKRFPEWIYRCDREIQLSFVKGLIDADGYVFEDKWGCKSYNITLANKEMLEDLKHLLDINKIKTGFIRPRKHTGKVIIKGKEYNSRQSYDFTFYLEGKTKEQPKKFNILNSSKNVELYKIKSITKDLPEETYDIQVSKNSNFIADGIIVHNSYIEPARRLYKSYTLLEDAMLIHRITRAPEKRIFYINVGSIPPNEVEQFMQKTISKMKRTPYIDSKTGDYNLKYNMQNLMEDFYIPVRGNDTSTKIDTAKGLEYDGIKDVEYMRDKLFAALKVPKAFLGYEKDIEGKCIDPLTKIPLLDGRTLTASDLINEFNEGKKNYVYSIDEETHSIVPGEIEWAGMTRLNTETVKVWLDNGEFIRTTPDHKFMLRNGDWIEAQYLQPQDSLMPLYRELSKNKKINGYDTVYNPSTGKYEFTHRIVADYYGIKKNNDSVIHHIDCNKLNNNPNNLDGSMNFWEHRQWHVDNTMLCNTDEANNKRIKTWAELSQNEEWREKNKDRFKKQGDILSEWISENGASRKGFIKYETSVCKGCNNLINDSQLGINERYIRKYCSNECRLKNWKSKYNSISLDQLINSAKNCVNFKELKNALGIKDYGTLRKLLKFHGFESYEFILEFMPNSHNNIKFMNQFPETNEYYINNYNPDHKEWKEKYSYKNHKVVRIEICNDLIDTCDISIKDHHNFGTEAGIIIHNSTLASQDIRFARTIDRIQRIFLSEMHKIALIHLYSQGYKGEELTSFELSMTTPSIIYDQERIELIKVKAEAAQQLIESEMFSTDWIYDNIYKMSTDSIDEMREQISYDKKRTFRYSQIENEGNDPRITNRAYGTPHSLASLYGPGRGGDKSQNVPTGYDENTPLGRPEEEASNINKQEGTFGKDRLGNIGMAGKDNNESDSINPQPKGGPMALSESFKNYLKNKSLLDSIPLGGRPILLFEEENKPKSNLLNEDNINELENI